MVRVFSGTALNYKIEVFVLMYYYFHVLCYSSEKEIHLYINLNVYHYF